MLISVILGICLLESFEKSVPAPHYNTTEEFCPFLTTNTFSVSDLHTNPDWQCQVQLRWCYVDPPELGSPLSWTGWWSNTTTFLDSACLIPPGTDSFNQSKNIKACVRSPRAGEEDGKAYNFVTKSQMEAAIDNGDFIEFATFAGNMYGTSRKAVETVMEKGEGERFAISHLTNYYSIFQVIQTRKCSHCIFD